MTREEAAAILKRSVEELNDVLDINGWDLKKALQHFHRSNATMFEWSNSPVVYYTTEEWQQLYDRVASRYFS